MNTSNTVSSDAFVWCTPQVSSTCSLNAYILPRVSLSVLADVDFNVSGMFAMPAPASNHNNHVDYDCGTIERKRPHSMVATDSDMSRKDR